VLVVVRLMLRIVVITASPMARLMAATANLDSRVASVVNGVTTAAAVARPTIQTKNVRGLGANRSRRCISAAATNAATAAAAAYRHVLAFTNAPFVSWIKTVVLKMLRAIMRPTTATPAATMATATPPAQNRAASTVIRSVLAFDSRTGWFDRYGSGGCMCTSRDRR
jgi:hypothetical protein